MIRRPISAEMLRRSQHENPTDDYETIPQAERDFIEQRRKESRNAQTVIQR